MVCAGAADRGAVTAAGRAAARTRTAPSGETLVMRLPMVLGLLLLCGTATADMADLAHRSKIGDIDLITYRTGVKDVVVILGVLPAGDAMAESGNIAIPTLSGMMLDRGTKALDKFAIAEKLDNVGAEISFTVGTQSLALRAKCLRKDLPLVVGLIAAELRSPALQPAEFNKAKQQLVGELEASVQNSGARASEAFNRAIFPEGHPNRPHSVAEYTAAAKSATLEALKAFQAKYYGPAHMTLVVVGDVSAPDTEAEVAKSFSGWTGGQDYVRPAKPAAAAAGGVVTVPLADKPSVTMILGQATGLRYRDPDALALRVGTAILGHGFTGRLMNTVRDKEGLTYNISANMGEDSVVDGAWEITASFAPTLLAKGVASTRGELDKWWRDGITEQELAAHKQGLIGSYYVSLATTSGLAETILVDVQRGYDLGWLDGYPNALKALGVSQVNAAIKAHIKPPDMMLVEAGSIAPAP
jgi:zinc protease